MSHKNIETNVKIDLMINRDKIDGLNKKRSNNLYNYFVYRSSHTK